MKITFHGAAKTVTGSCYQIQTKNSKFLVDCGMFQGNKKLNKKNYEEFTFDPTKIDFVILTHAHIDHSGLIPKLVKKGFTGKIICTRGTKALCKIMLEDSGHIHEEEVKWENRKRLRKGLAPREPLYTTEDGKNAINFFKPVNYAKQVQITPTIKAIFHDAGHILGASSVEVFVEGKKIIFSGDIGNFNSPYLKNPWLFTDCDYLLLESTYGDRIHPRTNEMKAKLRKCIIDVIKRGGNLVIPSFAIGRTQQLLYFIDQLYDEKAIPEINVYIDSPLATKATKIIEQFPEYYNEETQKHMQKDKNPFSFPHLFFTKSVQESKDINNTPGSKIIISASGMATAGRIKHHLKHNLWRDDCTVLFVGFQAKGTLGRYILNGEKRVRMLGEEVDVKAKIRSLEGLSAHADKNTLIKFIKNLKNKPKKIFLVHGELDSLSEAKRNYTKLGHRCHIPAIHESLEL